MVDENNWPDRTVVVTGGARGQGAALAAKLVARGCRVVVGDVREDEGRALAERLGAQCEFVVLDVADPDSWQALKTVVARTGRLDGLVNNAGIFDPRPILDTDVALFQRHVAVNQLGTFLGLKFAAELADGADLSVVNISSISGLRGTGGAAYTSTKWAVRGMTKMAAAELAEHGIRVNSVHPGLIDTKMIEAIDPDRLARRTAQIPMQRRGSEDEVVDVVLFLLSPASRYVNGAEIAVDGGLSV
ncbi:SDR family NAD(P)-dependent oxidoreductase [Salinisphaera sp. T31B1]|uniref:SDR family NAD(P)-dependent oxidoreductase n=1 Tax=Salinisphaera sp. T31B1 TaxID=727963 RepID=UPI003341775F